MMPNKKLHNNVVETTYNNVNSCIPLYFSNVLEIVQTQLKYIAAIIGCDLNFLELEEQYDKLSDTQYIYSYLINKSQPLEGIHT